jgi:ubiquitin carboxyl-terminal hydrolase 4/11/15
MDDEAATEEVERMDLDGSATPLPNGHSTNCVESSSESNPDRKTRDKSVDMLGASRGGSASVDKNAAPGAVQSNATDGTATSSTSATILPTIDQQVKTIMEQATSSELRDGDIGYVISVPWLNRVLSRSSEADAHGPFEKNAMEGEIGPIDNSSILLRG